MTRKYFNGLHCGIGSALFYTLVLIVPTHVDASVIVTVMDDQGRPIPRAPVNIYPITTAGGLTYLPLVAVTPTPTSERGVATFNVGPGSYQIEVGKFSRYVGAIQVVRVGSKNTSIAIKLKRNGLVVEPPGVFDPVPLIPEKFSSSASRPGQFKSAPGRTGTVNRPYPSTRSFQSTTIPYRSQQSRRPAVELKNRSQLIPYRN